MEKSPDGICRCKYPFIVGRGFGKISSGSDFVSYADWSNSFFLVILIDRSVVVVPDFYTESKTSPKEASARDSHSIKL